MKSSMTEAIMSIVLSIAIIGAFLLTPAHAQNRPFVGVRPWGRTV